MVARIKDSNEEALFWFQQAIDYYESSKILEDSSRECVGIPIITMQSFSIECSLKSFLLMCGEELMRIHGLAQLFNALPLSLKDDISNKFYELYGASFKDSINEINSDFVDSRYFFDEFKQSPVSRAFSTGYLNAIAGFLLDYAKEYESFLKSFNCKV